jgi:hypothetical protein
MPLEVPILEIKPPPVYQQIAPTAKHLQELGMSQSEIGRRLGVDRWTVGKAHCWLKGVAGRPNRLDDHLLGSAILHLLISLGKPISTRALSFSGPRVRADPLQM